MSNVVKLPVNRPEPSPASDSPPVSTKVEEAAGSPGDAPGTSTSVAPAAELSASGQLNLLPAGQVAEGELPGEVVEEHVRVEVVNPASPVAELVRFATLTIISSGAVLWYLIKSSGGYVLRHPLHVLLNLCMIGVLSLVVVTGSEIHSQMILGKISDQTVDAVIEGSRFTREFDSEEVNRGSTREFLRVGAPVWTQRESVRAILFNARKSGLGIEDQAVLLAIADIESGFNPMARAATTTACGLFQFVKRTGELFGLSQADCMNPWRNAEAGIAHYLYNFDRRVAPALANTEGTERLFRMFELSYYLHHDGPESRNPSNDVKATILGGTHFLFRAYRALKSESESQQRAPTFTEKFASNFWKTLDSVKTFVTNFSVLRLVSGDESGYLSWISSFLGLGASNVEAQAPREVVIEDSAP